MLKPSYLELAYRGNFVSHHHHRTYHEIYTYKGKVWIAFPDDGHVMELRLANGCFVN